MKKFFMAVIALMMTLSVSAQFYIYLSSGEVLQADSISMVAPPLLSGEFSVSASEKVHFSQGNLQYQASTQTWRFAESQYDIIGSNNTNISASYSGWIDLFGWGTGNNPTNTSMSSSSYSTFTNWGVNEISNSNQWRTLTMDEWVYLFYGRPDAAHLFGMGSVNGINGTILLPDDWAGEKFTDTDSGLANQGNYYYNSNNNYSFHTYTAEQWKTMEEAGAIFLPAAGRRFVTNMYYVGSDGYYWSASPYNEDAYIVQFNSHYLRPQDKNSRIDGLSVRLVR